MRLDKLTIGSFKNLQDFSIDFDEQSPTTVLVGRNGAGKSNLLEALTIIFRDLDLGDDPSFDYVLEYVCRGRKVKIEAIPLGHAKATVDGVAVPLKKLSNVDGKRLLPSYVFGYYSGPSNRMEEHFDEHQKRFYRDLLDGKDQSLRSLFYARPIHSQFVLLAFFLKEEAETQQFLRDHLGIERLESVLFVINEPPWKSQKGDERFWKARGTVSQFLDRLYELALAPLRRQRRVNVGFRKTTSREHLYLYLRDITALRGLAEYYSSQQELFKALESTYISQLICEVRIRVTARNVDGSLTFRELSEGEQQLLMVIGLLRFTREEESLLLLDEPDTHLNPAWSLEYLDMIEKVVGDDPSSHVLMTTHDPLVLINLEREQVRIMLRDEQTGQIRTEIPEDSPKDMGVDGLLTSELFGLQAAIGIELQGLLAERATLISTQNKSDTDNKRLQELAEKLSHKGFATVDDDPIYKSFLTAIARRSNWSRPVLTPNEKAEQNRIADEILAEIMPEDDE